MDIYTEFKGVITLEDVILLLTLSLSLLPSIKHI